MKNQEINSNDENLSINSNYYSDKSFKEKQKHIKNKNDSSKQKNKKHNPILHFIKNILLILLIFIILCGGYIGFKTYQNGGGIKGFLCAILFQDEEDTKNLEPITVLLLGVSTDLDSELTDTIMVCQYDPTSQTASILSIPRDTFIGKSAANAKGSDKINALYSKGVSKTISAVNTITGLDIKYYAVVNNNALINLVNIIGGVNFDVPIDMDYDDPTQDLHIHLKAGMQTIDGDEVEQLLRFRHNNDGTSYPASYGDNDFGRMKTQRAFIEATIKQTLTIKNLPKAYAIINSIFNNVETNLNKDILFPYIPDATEFDTSTISSNQLPGESIKLNDLWFFDYSKSKTKELVKEIFK